MAQRDEKGRFVKGNTEGNRFRSDNGTASEAGRKGADSTNAQRKERKTLAETLRAELAKDAGSGMTKQEYIVAKCLENLAKGKCTPADLKTMSEVLGEFKVNLDLNAAVSGKPQLAFTDMTDHGDNTE